MLKAEKLSPRPKLKTLVEWDKDCLAYMDDSKHQVLCPVGGPNGG
jgi:hypothetical protein